MSVMTCNSESAKRLLSALGVPTGAISVDIRLAEGEPVIVTCEYYLDEPVIGEDGELETIFKKYVLTETEEAVDGF